MAWKTVAVAQSEDELRTLKPSIADIPNGSQVLITIELPAWLPLAHIVNLPVEWLTQKFLGAIQITDVRANGFYIIEIHGIAQGILWVVVLPILIAVLAGLSAFGIYAWKEIRVSYYEAVTAQAEAEEAKAEVTKIALPGLVAEGMTTGEAMAEVTAWLKGIKSPPVEYQSAVNWAKPLTDMSKAAVPALGISIGVLLLIVAAVFFSGRRL